MTDPKREPICPEDPELTEEEAEGIRLALEQIDRGEAIPAEQVFAELRAEIAARAQARRTG